MKKIIPTVSILLLVTYMGYAQKKVSISDIKLKTISEIDTNYIAYLKGSDIPFSGLVCDYYFPNDSIEMSETTYINGKPVGKWETFYEDGKLHEEGANNENGEKDGKYHEYYDMGIVKCDGDYVNGLKTNVWLYYYDNGDFHYGGQYVSDKRWGIWRYRDHKGKEIKQVTYDMDVITDIKTDMQDSISVHH